MFGILTIWNLDVWKPWRFGISNSWCSYIGLYVLNLFESKNVMFSKRHGINTWCFQKGCECLRSKIIKYPFRNIKYNSKNIKISRYQVQQCQHLKTHLDVLNVEVFTLTYKLQYAKTWRFKKSRFKKDYISKCSTYKKFQNSKTPWDFLFLMYCILNVNAFTRWRKNVSA